MSIRGDTLSALNDARDDLTDRIVTHSGSPVGSPAWQKMMVLVRRRDQIGAQIDTIIAASFDAAADGLPAAVAGLQKSTEDLKKLHKTLDAIDGAISTTDAIVQAATHVIALAFAAGA